MIPEDSHPTAGKRGKEYYPGKIHNVERRTLMAIAGTVIGKGCGTVMKKGATFIRNWNGHQKYQTNGL